MCSSHLVDEDDCRRRYRLLQAHLLIAHVLVTRKYKIKLEDWEKYGGEEELLLKKANPEPAALAIRVYLNDTKGRLLLDRLPVQFPPDLFLDQLNSVGLDKADKERFDDIVRFFKKAYGNEKQGTKNFFSGESPEWGPRVGGSNFKSVIVEYDSSLGDSSYTATTHGTQATVTRVKLNSAKVEELLDLDDSPLEGEDAEESDYTSFDEPGFSKDPGAYQEASRAQANHIEMANQSFPWSYGSLVPAELSHLIIELPKRMLISLAAGTVNPEDLEELEVLALVQVMFWTSSSQERARALKVLGRPTTDKAADLAFIPGSEAEGPRWRIHAPLPRYATQQDAVPDLDRNKTEFLELPDPVDGSRLLQEFLQRKKLQVGGEHDGAKGTLLSGKSASVFSREESWYKERVKQLLAKVTQELQLKRLSAAEQSSRVTEGKIANFMLQRILVESKGDLTAAAIITGHKLPLARVRLFYACRSVQKLQSLYVSATVGVDRELRMISGDELVRVLPGLDSGDMYIGNRRCPTLKAAADAISLLKSLLKKGRSIQNNPKNLTEFCRYHNLYTLYTVWMFSYYTGVRGIGTPYLGLSEIDQESGLAQLVDKDTGLKYKAKLVWVPPALLKQMRMYSEFVSRIPWVSEPVKKETPCFFISRRLKPVVVRPLTQVAFMKEFLPFPVNIHRRFVSSELLDSGCPPEIVSAWMGHWHRGEEPWAKFSSFSYSEYSRVLETYLLKGILKELKFEPIPFKVNSWTK
jgi:hypothetical protein